MKKHSPLIFLHIPKVAGTTLLSILERGYGKDHVFIWRPQQSIEQNRNNYLDLPERFSMKPNAIVGHVSFGIDKFLPSYEDYFTMLREPIGLSISRYNYRKNRVLKNVSVDVLSDHAKSLSLIEFCQQTEDNPMTRFLSGYSLEEKLALNSTQSSFEDLQISHISAPIKPCPPEMLSQAKLNLEKNILTFGLTEYFDESLMLFKRDLNIPLRSLFYVKKNVRTGETRSTPYPEETIATISSINSLDVELYDFAKQLFIERIETMGSPFKKDTVRFSQLNKLLGPVENTLSRGSSGAHRFVRRAKRRLPSFTGS